MNARAPSNMLRAFSELNKSESTVFSSSCRSITSSSDSKVSTSNQAPIQLTSDFNLPYLSTSTSQRPYIDYPNRGHLFLDNNIPLGSGSYGTVRSVSSDSTIQLAQTKHLAVKEISIPSTITPSFINSINQEISVGCCVAKGQANRVLGSEHCVAFYKDYTGITITVNGKPKSILIVMDKVPGAIQLKDAIPKLQHLSRDHKLALITKWVKQISSALSFLHREGFVHQDMSTKNILIDNNGDAKLIDYGLSIMTGTLASGGSPLYYSPESVSNKSLCKKHDIFGFGSILYEMINCTPYIKGGSTVFTIISKVKEESNNPIQTDDHNTSRTSFESLAKLAQRCHNSDPEQRPNASAILVSTLSNGELVDKAWAYFQAVSLETYPDSTFKRLPSPLDTIGLEEMTTPCSSYTNSFNFTVGNGMQRPSVTSCFD